MGRLFRVACCALCVVAVMLVLNAPLSAEELPDAKIQSFAKKNIEL